MNSLRILIIISLIADNNKDFLTLTSTYIQHLLRLKSWTKQLSTVSKILKAWYSKCDFLYLSFPNMSTTHFSSQLCLMKGHLEKIIQIFPLAAYTSKALEYFIQLWKRALFSNHLTIDHRAKSPAMFVGWAILVTSLPTEWIPSSRAPF